MGGVEIWVMFSFDPTWQKAVRSFVYIQISQDQSCRFSPALTSKGEHVQTVIKPNTLQTFSSSVWQQFLDLLTFYLVFIYLSFPGSSCVFKPVTRLWLLSVLIWTQSAVSAAESTKLDQRIFKEGTARGHILWNLSGHFLSTFTCFHWRSWSTADFFYLTFINTAPPPETWCLICFRQHKKKSNNKNKKQNRSNCQTCHVTFTCQDVVFFSFPQADRRWLPLASAG